MRRFEVSANEDARAGFAIVADGAALGACVGGKEGAGGGSRACRRSCPWAALLGEEGTGSAEARGCRPGPGGPHLLLRYALRI